MDTKRSTSTPYGRVARHRRRKMGLPKKAVASMAGVTVEAVRAVETGEDGWEEYTRIVHAALDRYHHEYMSGWPSLKGDGEYQAMADAQYPTHEMLVAAGKIRPPAPPAADDHDELSDDFTEADERAAGGTRTVGAWSSRRCRAPACSSRRSAGRGGTLAASAT